MNWIILAKALASTVVSVILCIGFLLLVISVPVVGYSLYAGLILACVTYIFYEYWKARDQKRFKG